MTGDPRRQPRGAGWEFVHVAVDDHSRVAYVELLPDEQTESVRAFVRRALAWFRARRVRIRRLLTDNGSAYLSRGFRATACCPAGWSTTIALDRTPLWGSSPP